MKEHPGYMRGLILVWDIQTSVSHPAAVEGWRERKELHQEVKEVSSSRIHYSSVFDLSSKVIDWLILETDGDWRSQVTTTLTGVKDDQVTYDDVSTSDCKEVASPVTASRRRAAIRRRMPESLQPYSDTNWSSEMSFHFSAWNWKFTCRMLQKVLWHRRLLPRIARNLQEICKKFTFFLPAELWPHRRDATTDKKWKQKSLRAAAASAGIQ